MRNEIHFQCQYRYHVESGVDFDTINVADKQVIVRDALSPYGLFENWSAWVENYSQRLFSVPTDKMPALAGIIQSCQSATNYSAMLGLWATQWVFGKQLLWRRHGSIRDAEREATIAMGIPSWSWLSCPAAIEYSPYSLTQSMRMMDHVDLINWSVTWTERPLTSPVM